MGNSCRHFFTVAVAAYYSYLLLLVVVVVSADGDDKGTTNNDNNIEFLRSRRDLKGDDFFDTLEDDDWPGYGLCVIGPPDELPDPTGEGSCETDADCFDVLVCEIRRAGQIIPPCCISTETGATNPNRRIPNNFCVPYACTRAGIKEGVNATEALCFSGDTSVEIEIEEGVSSSVIISMQELQIGDRIRTATQGYQPVYAFGHKLVDRPTPFLQLHTSFSSNYTTTTSDDDDMLLEMTGAHMIFVEGKVGPVRADSITVGDFLQTTNDDTASNRVTRIQHVTKYGLYAPLTLDGTIVVGNGVIASNYAAIQKQQPKQPFTTTTNNNNNNINNNNHEYVHLPIIGSIPLLQADAAHLGLGPFRLMCTSGFRRPSLCDSRDENGMLHYVSCGIELVQFWETRGLVVQLMMLLPLLVVLSICRVVEYLSFELGSGFVVAMVTGAIVVHHQRKPRVSTSIAK